jgi:hypothetical protein
MSIFANPLDQVNFDLKDNISERHQDEVLKFMLLGSYISVDNPELGTNISGFGGSFQAMYLLSDKFAIGGGAGTIMSEAGAGAASILNWAFTYSLTGRLKSTKSTYSLNGKQILSGSNSIAEGLRAQFFLSQYYFNATKNTIPYAGIGGQIYYDKYLKSIGTNALIGIRIDQLFNNEVGIMPMSLVFGILI